MARGTRGSTSDPVAEMFNALREVLESQHESSEAQRQFNVLMKERMDRADEIGQVAPGAPPPPPLP